MSRRCVTINLSPQVEMPASRTFERPDLIAEVLRDRGRYVAAAMTIVLAWIAAGEPKMMCPPLAGFTRWSDLCRQSLLWLGCPDPAASVFDSIADDPDRETLASFMNAWYAEFGSAPATVRAAIDRTLACGGNIELHEILHDIAGEHGVINRKKLGWWIKRHAGQIIDGRRVAHVPGRGPVGKWRIEGVKSVSSVS